MKKVLFLVCVAFLINACQTESLSESDMRPTKELSEKEALMILSDMGFDVSHVVETDEGYRIEGDILITDDIIKAYGAKEQTRAYFTWTNETVAPEKQNIRVYDYTGIYELYQPLRDAVDYWNEHSGCNIVLSMDQGDSEIQFVSQEFMLDDYRKDENTLMDVSLPAAGMPGRVTINSVCSYLPKNNPEQAKYMALHAIGHALGFTHMPAQFGEPNDGEGLVITGTELLDPSSIMVAPSNPLKWSGFSEDDIAGFQAKYPIPEPAIPDPDFDTIIWEQNDADYAILLGGTSFFVERLINFPNSVSKIGSGWNNFTGKEGMRIIRNSSDVVVYEGEACALRMPDAGEYTLQYGAAVWQEDSESYVCYYGTAYFTVTDPFVIEFPALDQGEELDLANSYVFRYLYEDSAWANCTATATVEYLETGEMVALSTVSERAWRIDSLPGRGRYKITVTVNNGQQTRSKARWFTVPERDASVQLYYNYAVHPVDYGKSAECVVSFYSDEACEQIAETQYTVECHYILWRIYHDLVGVEQSRTKMAEDIVLVPAGSETYAIPVWAPAVDRLSLDGYKFVFEVECQYL